MKVRWTKLAEIGRDNIAEYIRQSFGRKRMMLFIQELRKTIKLLCQFPDLGSIDPLFDDRPITYRSVIISRLSKFVYNIDGDTIYIAGFWDCRREPNAQAGQVK